MSGGESQQRIIDLKLDEVTLVRRSPEVEHERAIAIYDLLEENHFHPAGLTGPYNVHISVVDNRLIFDIRGSDDRSLTEVPLPLAPFRRIVKDYFLVCESYYAAIRHATPSKIEAIDMGRRGLHNEGSEMLRERLAGSIELDVNTARRLFTLLCILHIRG